MAQKKRQKLMSPTQREKLLRDMEKRLKIVENKADLAMAGEGCYSEEDHYSVAERMEWLVKQVDRLTAQMADVKAFLLTACAHNKSIDVVEHARGQLRHWEKQHQRNSCTILEKMSVAEHWKEQA